MRIALARAAGKALTAEPPSAEKFRNLAAALAGFCAKAS